MFVGIIPPRLIALSSTRDVLAALALVNKSEDPRDTNTMTFTPIRLQADTLALWLQAARRHSSWQVCVDEDAWDGTAEENYERQVGILV